MESATNGNLFADDWHDCLRSHYRYLVEQGDQSNEKSLLTVLHEINFTDEQVLAMRRETVGVIPEQEIVIWPEIWAAPAVTEEFPPFDESTTALVVDDIIIDNVVDTLPVPDPLATESSFAEPPPVAENHVDLAAETLVMAADNAYIHVEVDPMSDQIIAGEILEIAVPPADEANNLPLIDFTEQWPPESLKNQDVPPEIPHQLSLF